MSRGTSLDDLAAVEIGPIPTRPLAERIEALLQAPHHTRRPHRAVGHCERAQHGPQWTQRSLRSALLAGGSNGRDAFVAADPARPPLTRAVQSAARTLLATLDKAEDLIHGTERLETAYARTVNCAFGHGHSNHDPRP